MSPRPFPRPARPTFGASPGARERTPPPPSRRSSWRRRRLRRVAAALLAAVSVLLLGASLRPPPPARAPTVGVLVAGRDLAPGTTLRATDLTTGQWPPGLLPAGASMLPTAAVGRVLAGAVLRGEPIGPGRLVPTSPAQGLRAGEVVLRVTVLGAGGESLLTPGRHVDVYGRAAGGPVVKDAVVRSIDPPGGTGFVDPPGEIGPADGPVPDDRATGSRGVLLSVPLERARALLATGGEGPPVVRLLLLS